jgi:Protein of unknown function (DUF4232)
MIAPPRPPHDDPELLIKEARDRQRRRRLIVAISAVTVAGLELATYAVLARPTDMRNEGSGPRTGAPLCRSSQLAASFTPGAAAGTDLGGLIVRNTGGATCSLPAGRPHVNVSFRGKPLPTVERSWSPQESFGKPAHDLAPGAGAFLEIGWSDACMTVTTTAPSSRFATLRIRFRDGLSMVVPETPPDRSVVVPGCNGVVTRPTPAIVVSRFLRL